MPTITQLEYLLAVQREKHFGKAANSCFVSQPSLSIQIQKAEEELGVVIFDRSKKPILTTSAGAEILAQAEIVIRELKKLNTIASQESHELKGEFSLAVIPTLAPYLIPLFVKGFSEAYPMVSLKINEHKTEDIIRLLSEDRLDAALLVTPLDDHRIIERHLFFEPFYAYVSTAHKLAAKKTLSESDLELKDLWLLEEGHCFRDQVLRVCNMDKSQKVLTNVEFESGNLETLKNLVRKSSGYTLLPDLAMRELSESDRQIYIKKFKKPIPTREVSLVHSRSFYKENIIGAMEQLILNNLPKNLKSLKRNDIEIVDIY